MTTESPTLFEPYLPLAPRQYLRQTWDLMPVTWLEARTELRNRLSQFRLGLLWVVLQPVLLILVYVLVFGVLFDASSRTKGVPFLAYLALGRYAFNLLADTTRQGMLMTRSVKNYEANRTLLSVLISRNLSIGLQSLGELVVALVIVLAMGFVPKLDWMMVPALLVVTALFTVAFGAVLALISAVAPDFVFFYNSVVRLAFFASGVVIPVESFVLDRHGEQVLEWFTLGNPFFAFVKLWQFYLLDYETVGAGHLWASVCIWTLLPLGFGAFAIARLETIRWWLQ